MHVLEETASVAALYLPAAQSIHAPPAAVLYVPAGHTVHVVAPTLGGPRASTRRPAPSAQPVTVYVSPDVARKDAARHNGSLGSLDV